ncbi:hypothetical protein ACFFNY_03635 [Paenibacillus hodogayensis]|uniref:Uncharacterized protein n=1 Tax=Paenibacillus hodogayensis TaxID=279208 RepID=A0ABV5VQU5_9BACL
MKTEGNLKSILLMGILICLAIIAFKPTPELSLNSPPQSYITTEGETVVQLGENKIAIVDTRANSGLRGQIIVLEFDVEKKSFNQIGNFNYLNSFSNPTNITK